MFSALISQATRWAITLVFPEPAPARTSKFFDSDVTAFHWGSFNVTKISETSTQVLYL